MCKILVILAVTSFSITMAKKSDVQKKMEAGEIVPDVIDEAASNKIHILYPSGKSVEFGKELTPLEVKDIPVIKYEANPDKYYVLVMIDPDAPSKETPTFSEVRHWLVGNIKGSNVISGEDITEYLGSGPPKGTGLHRYIFLVYEQPGKIEFDEPHTTSTSRAHRFKFSVRAFAAKYNLGKPIAGNYFKAQWDSYVDERNKFIINN